MQSDSFMLSDRRASQSQLTYGMMFFSTFPTRRATVPFDIGSLGSVERRANTHYLDDALCPFLIKPPLRISAPSLVVCARAACQPSLPNLDTNLVVPFAHQYLRRRRHLAVISQYILLFQLGDTKRVEFSIVHSPWW
jgi:hypothetical protein